MPTTSPVAGSATAPSKPPSARPEPLPILRHFQLNLMTPEQKKSLRLHLIFLTLRNVLFVLLLETLVLGSLLLAGRQILEASFRQAVEQTVSITTTFSASNREIHTLNDEIKNLQKIQNQFVPTGDLYGGVLALMPPGISLTTIRIDVASRDLRLRGVAKTRPDLNRLNAALTASSLLQDLQSPLSNLFVKQNIPFEFSARLVTGAVPVPMFITASSRASASSTQPL